MTCYVVLCYIHNVLKAEAISFVSVVTSIEQHIQISPYTFHSLSLIKILNIAFK